MEWGGGYELNFEHGYRLYNKLVSVFSENGQAITVANSLLITALLGKLIKKTSPYVFLSVWLYVTLGIFQTQMNMARNAIAILICYLGCRYIEERKVVRFLVYIVGASLFHVSSILFVPLYWLVHKVKLTPRKTRRLMIASVILGLSFSLIRPLVVEILPFGFGRYFEGNTTKLEGLIVGVFHLALSLFVLIFIRKRERMMVLQSAPVGNWMLVLEILFFCIGYDVASATRMAALFGPYLIIFIPILIEKGIQSKRQRLNVMVLVVLMTGIQYIIRLQINNIGSTIPYMFFWS